MKKLMDIDIADIIPFSKGIIVARKDTLKNGEIKISFITYDVKLERPSQSTKGAYLFNKFGDAYEKITEQLSDDLSCDAVVLPNKHVAISYKTGEVGYLMKKALFIGLVIYSIVTVLSAVLLPRKSIFGVLFLIIIALSDIPPLQKKSC